jgi:hypothetical protein
MVGKFQLVTHSVRIKNKLHSKSTIQYVADGQDAEQTRLKAVEKLNHHRGTIQDWFDHGEPSIS